MFEEFLTPYSINNNDYTSLQIGRYIYTDIESVEKNSIVLISCPKGKSNNQSFISNNKIIKESLYSLALGNWKLPIINIGEILPGNTEQDTQFALQQIITYCLNKNAFPILLGGSMELLYYFYRSFNNEKLINISTLDAEIKLNIFQEENLLNEENFLFKIINDNPNNLFHFANLGYQTYLTSYKILDTLHALDFETLRLGDIINNLQEVEPILRSTDLVGINVNSIQNTNKKFNTYPNPNGFSAREICAIARYIGVSPQMKGAVISNFLNDPIQAQIISQSIWYIIEGLNKRTTYKESKKNYLYYTVLHSDQEIIFIKDKIIDKWWIKLEVEKDAQKSKLIPCTYSDYVNAVSGEIPERYLLALKKKL